MYKILIFLFIPILSFSQRTEVALSFSEKNNRLDFELNNDMLFSTDNYYTAGIAFSYTNKKFEKTLAQLILKPRFKNVLNYSGFGVEQRMFTPTSITQPGLVPHDQPYSAYLLLTNFSVNVNLERKMKVSNEIGVGLMGPYAFGEEMQTLVHKAVGSAIPVGWENQLRSTFLLDYQFRIERGFGADWFANHVVTFVDARFGTLINRIQLGTMIKFGNKNRYLQELSLGNIEKKLIWEWVFSANLQGVFYDATLQGGLFSNDPNALSSNEIISHQYRFRMGVTLYYQNFSLRYMINYNSSTFNESVYHRYGGINIGYSF